MGLPGAISGYRSLTKSIRRSRAVSANNNVLNIAPHASVATKSWVFWSGVLPSATVLILLACSPNALSWTSVIGSWACVGVLVFFISIKVFSGILNRVGYVQEIMDDDYVDSDDYHELLGGLVDVFGTLKMHPLMKGDRLRNLAIEAFPLNGDLITDLVQYSPEDELQSGSTFKALQKAHVKLTVSGMI